MTPSQQTPPNHRTIVSYVQRGERMTVGQQRAWDTHWDRIGQDVKALPEGPVDFAGWFGREAPVLLEIGSGMGETTSQLVAAAPDVNYVAVEVYKPGLAMLILRTEQLGADNLRALRGDAVDLLTDHVPPASLAGVRIFFPDPWPKKKHHKRRLVQPEFISLLSSRLVPGGMVHLATDWENYADQMMAVLSAEPTLHNPHADEPGGWAPRPQWRPITKFEQRAVEEGRISHDLMFVRNTVT